EATRGTGNTGETLLRILEQRIDNVVRRAGFTRSVWASRQLVVHGHVLVNGKKVDRPSAHVKIGDVVTLREGVHKLCRENMESLAGHVVPPWLEMNPAELSVRVLTMPTSDQVPFDVNTNLIVELYR
ncbi:MAG TPA: 30S ribosomal protein S4, partial [Phycisphaerales bacterium]|nr:30S ribosomal protein S4 [Phycisphaerales bacterium]